MGAAGLKLLDNGQQMADVGNEAGGPC
jgi:hypothetical protein